MTNKVKHILNCDSFSTLFPTHFKHFTSLKPRIKHTGIPTSVNSRFYELNVLFHQNLRVLHLLTAILMKWNMAKSITAKYELYGGWSRTWNPSSRYVEAAVCLGGLSWCRITLPRSLVCREQKSRQILQLRNCSNFKELS